MRTIHAKRKISITFTKVISFTSHPSFSGLCLDGGVLLERSLISENEFSLTLIFIISKAVEIRPIIDSKLSSQLRLTSFHDFT